MKRYFYLSNDLDDLEAIEAELERGGLSIPQIHVISKDDAGLDTHALNQMHQWLQTDVVHYTVNGALIGAVGSILAISAAYLSGVMSYIGVMPFIFLSIVILGFCTWEAGFIGTQRPNRYFKKFQKALNRGKHLLMVDITPEEKAILKRVCANHPKLHKAGVGIGAPNWAIFSQKKAYQFAQSAP